MFSFLKHMVAAIVPAMQTCRPPPVFYDIVLAVLMQLRSKHRSQHVVLPSAAPLANPAELSKHVARAKLALESVLQ